jgi:thiamine-monophosphate kinase
VYVTGTLGDAAVGLRLLQDSGRADPEGRPVNACVQRYLLPEPRVRAGLLLGRNRAASSCMDLSDGLADGVRQVAQASGVGMTIDAAAMPIGADARAWHTRAGMDPIAAALGGGDDYELLFTVRPAHRGRLRGVRAQLGDLPVTRIGVVTKSRDLLVRHGDGAREISAGYEHFRPFESLRVAPTLREPQGRPEPRRGASNVEGR